MHKGALLIAASGLVLVLAGFINGLVLTQSQSHTPRLVAHDAYRPALTLLAEGSDAQAWQDERETISARSLAYQRVIGFHTHAINMAVLLVLIAFLYGLLPPGVRGAAPALTAFALACWLYPLGLLLHVFELTTAARVLAAGGAGLAVISLAWLAILISNAVGPVDE
ncbi:MAG: hypothetical protein HKO62_08715 [Gammaproteobacteria bacterium]|nr:hypothetical protein [Gammaproteobacteria bacterium]NNM00817.1 hypothetical protein [Gammaproteobacteria bacterium]